MAFCGRQLREVGQHILEPLLVVTDAAGAVEEAGDDGIFFVLPHG